MKRSKNKAADKILKSVMDELKHDELENSQRTDLFDIDGGADPEPAQFSDIAISSKPAEEDPTARLAPEGISDETARQITKTVATERKRVSSSEATIVSEDSSSDDTATQPAASIADHGGFGGSSRKHEDEATNTAATNVTSPSLSFADKTQPMYRPYSPSVPASGSADAGIKVSPGVNRGAQARATSNASGGTSELQLLQAENLKLAQGRILELEKEMERLRQENELLYSAGEIGKRQNEEYSERLNLLERTRAETQQQADAELSIFKESLQERERELKKSKARVAELEKRLATDLKKVRVRERELENRLELARMEKTTLLRAKDDTILELKRKIDFLNSELDQYKQRNAELSQKIEQEQTQMARTVRALRLALSNLEANGGDASATLPILKKAE